MREGRRGSEAQDVRVSFHVHESVAAHVERDDAALPALLREEADFLAAERICEERKGESPEIRAAAEAGDHQVRIFADLLELPLGLEADDRLMEEDMVQDGAEAVDRLVIAPRVLEPF